MRTSAKEKSVATERDATLQAFLSKHNARCMWQQRVTRVGTLECYVAHAHVFLVQRGNHAWDGWEVYIPASESNNVATTLAALQEYIER